LSPHNNPADEYAMEERLRAIFFPDDTGNAIASTERKHPKNGYTDKWVRIASRFGGYYDS